MALRPQAKHCMSHKCGLQYREIMSSNPSLTSPLPTVIPIFGNISPKVLGTSNFIISMLFISLWLLMRTFQ